MARKASYCAVSLGFHYWANRADAGVFCAKPTSLSSSQHIYKSTGFDPKIKWQEGNLPLFNSAFRQN